jgi:hypothetical protein
MSFETDFLELMPHTVQLAPPTGRDQFNKASFGADVSYRARVVGKGMSLRTKTSVELTPLFTVYVDAGDDVITAEYRLTLPADLALQRPAGSATPVIFTVSKLTDEDGNHHTVLNCGWMYHRQGMN